MLARKMVHLNSMSVGDLRQRTGSYIEGALTVPDVLRYWDREGGIRESELYPNNDPAYESLLCFLERHLSPLVDGDAPQLLDAGCGVGGAEALLVGMGWKVRAIDPSAESVEIARKHNLNLDVTFEACSIEDLAYRNPRPEFEVVLANMVLHNCPDVYAFVSAAWKLLKPGGWFIFTLTQPWTYPAKHGILHDNSTPTMMMLPLRPIRRGISEAAEVPYFSRPLSLYLSALKIEGFEFPDVEEPRQIGPGRSSDTVYIATQRPLETAK